MRCAKFSPNGKLIASASDDGYVRIWSVDSGKCFRTIEQFCDFIWTVDFSPDGNHIVVALDNGKIKVWKVN